MTDSVHAKRFNLRDAAISAGTAAGFFCLIVGWASLTTHSFPWSLAAVLTVVLLPLGISGGIQSNN
jgi:hypothetical protein